MFFVLFDHPRFQSGRELCASGTKLTAFQLQLDNLLIFLSNRSTTETWFIMDE